MSSITPKPMYISRDSIIDVCQETEWWKFRNVVFNETIIIDLWGRSFPGEAPSAAVIGLVAKSIADHVEQVEVDCGTIEPADLKAFLSGICSPLATRLKKVRIHVENSLAYGNAGNIILSALRNAPSLEELELVEGSVRFPSGEGVEEFFANTNIKKLVLENVQLSPFASPWVPRHSRDDPQARMTELAVAEAFRRGLQRNQSLRKVTFRDVREGPFFRECLLGIKNHRHINDLTVSTLSDSLAFFSDQIKDTVRLLVSDTTSIRKLRVENIAHVEVFRGLTTNSTTEEVIIERTDLLDDDDDAETADAIQQCCRNNSTLQKVSFRFDELGPQARTALIAGVSSMASLKNVSLHKALLASRDWRLLAGGIRNVGESQLQVLDLSDNLLSTQDLETIFPCLYGLEELSLKSCGITFDSVPVICDYIRKAPLKKLELGQNPMRAEGVARIFEAVSGSVSLEHLGMDGVTENRRDRVPFNFNECRQSLQTLLVRGRLKCLVLSKSNDFSDNVCLNVDSIRSIAGGLKKSETLETFQLPRLDPTFIHILGEAMVDNRSLERLEVSSSRLPLPKLTPEVEESVLAFIRLMPRMKTLVSLKGLFHFEKTPENVTRALVAALKENTTLEEIDGGSSWEAAVQFYLELNRLGRHRYEAASENNPINVDELLHFYARMADPEYASHMYYFVRRTLPNLLAGHTDGTSLVKGGPSIQSRRNLVLLAMLAVLLFLFLLIVALTKGSSAGDLELTFDLEL